MKAFCWGMKLLTLTTVLLILQGAHGVGLAGCIWVSLVAAVWDVCTYADLRGDERK